MHLHANPATDRAYLAGLLLREHEGGAPVWQIAERWGIADDTVRQLLAEAEEARKVVQAPVVVPRPRRALEALTHPFSR